MVGVSLYLDLFSHRHATEISVSNAAKWSAFWVFLALCFYGYLWGSFSKEWADLYLAGYFLEKSLSIDNLMVFMAIFASFGIKSGLQHRILYWGILGALVLRAIFVLIGASLFMASLSGNQSHDRAGHAGARRHRLALSREERSGLNQYR